jgi:hypothetical protein
MSRAQTEHTGKGPQARVGRGEGAGCMSGPPHTRTTPGHQRLTHHHSVIKCSPINPMSDSYFPRGVAGTAITNTRAELWWFSRESPRIKGHVP